ncbi:MAG: AI-2E family transporter [Candidatus Rokubacteria bacterium]|nr:AI-2E family transporter [Candidatus Rokubacteria bacterium]
MNTEILSRQRWVQLGALALLIALALAVLRPFIVPVAWAAILAYATWPLFRRVERGLGGRSGWAALATTVFVVLVVVGPAVTVSLALASEIQQAVQDLRAWAAAGRRPPLPEWVRQVPVLGPIVAERGEAMLADPGALQEWVRSQAGPWARSLTGAIGGLARNVAGAGLALLTLFFLYRHGRTVIGQIERVARGVAGERVRVMLHPLGETVRAVMYGMLLTALAQGGLAMLGYWVAGLGAPALLGAATTLLALIPFGAPMVYVPAGAWLFVQGRPLAGFLLLAWGTLVVSTVDNVIRTWFISGATRVPFLLVFFGVLGGLAAFGSLGLFVGPVVISLLLVLWREWTEQAEAS